MLKRLSTAGTFRLDSDVYLVGGRYGLKHVLVVVDGNDLTITDLTITDLQGELLIEHTRPAPGITYVGNGRPRHAPNRRKCHHCPETSSHRCPDAELSPMS